MTTAEVKTRFEKYQDIRNLYISMQAASNPTMNVIPDPEATELLMIMRSIYDFAYQQAISDTFATSYIDFPNDSNNKE